MIELNIPGRGVIQLEHLVSDVNGTLAVDGKLHDGLIRRIGLLRDRLEIHLLTADTHGHQHIIDQQLNLKAAVIGVGLISIEGSATETLLASDLIVPDIYAAFDLLENPLRIVATLRK